LVNTFAADGLTFDVSDGGPASGTPVVLLHGFPQDSSCWSGVASRLQSAGLRTLAPDQRGYSPGARPSSPGAYRLRRVVDDVIALLDAAGLDKAHVVGHDWGGAAAWGVAGWYPERTASLTVVSTPHPAAMATALRSPEQLGRSWYMAVFMLPVLPEVALRQIATPMLRRSGLPEDAAAHYTERLREPGAATGMLNWYRALPRSLGDVVPPSTVPTTYVWGRADPALGPHAARLTAGQVQASYTFLDVPGGHWLPERQPDTVADAVLAQVRAVS